MGFTYKLPSDYELVSIPTEKERKTQCRCLVELIDNNLDTFNKLDGLVGYGIGISSDNWCKTRIKLTFSHKMNDLQMYEGVKIIAELPGISYDIIEGKQETKPGGRAFSGQRIKHER